ncbi:MAG TPA: hypothetical protein VFV34_24750 [Blastocatellia bacterium]|nr:hypothetical protein [Blastocatellia bacterium]
MKRRSLVLMMILSLAGFAGRCDKSDVLSEADDVLVSLKAAAPLIGQFLPGSTERINQAVTIAEKLKVAIAASDSTNALALLSELVPVFQDIVEKDIPQIHSAASRTQIMAALAVADIGLHLLVKRLAEAQASGAVRVGAREHDALSSFAQQPVWGDKFKH